MPCQSKGLRDLGEEFTSEDRTVHTTDGKAYPVRFNLETGCFNQPAGPKACTLTCNLTQHWTFTDRNLNRKLFNQRGFFTFAVETNITDSRFLTSLCDLRA